VAPGGLGLLHFGKGIVLVPYSRYNHEVCRLWPTNSRSSDHINMGDLLGFKNTRLKSRLALSALCLATMTFSTTIAPTPASAASDVSGPVLVSSTVTPQALNIATGPATVKVTVRLTDQTGASAPVITVAPGT